MPCPRFRSHSHSHSLSGPKAHQRPSSSSSSSSIPRTLALGVLPIRLALASALFWAVAVASPQPPPAKNVHLVREDGGHRFWRGGAPTAETLQALAREARGRGVTVTLVDLRRDPRSAKMRRDDDSGKDGRLSSAAEKKLAGELGFHYVSVSALDRTLSKTLTKALGSGDIYMHCMYGRNRTGFATARYARATGVGIDRAGLGPRDWEQGDRFQAGLGNGRR